jgi:hypothetical protein
MNNVMTYEEMKNLEHFLMTTYWDQGGACSFLQWVEITSCDDEEYAHEEAKAYFDYVERDSLQIGA